MYLKLLVIVLYINYVHANRKNDTCGCYTLGTLANVEGESLCNEQTLQCRCLPNVTGINCDQCTKDHYDIFSGRGCTQCRPRCDQCAANKYKSGDVCANCNCDINGSKNLQCDRNGYCICQKNVEGKQCERCKENMYSIKEGCKPCPSCYNLVQNSTNNFTKHIHKADISLRRIEYNLSAVIQDFENFVTQIKILVLKIEELHNFDNTTMPSNIENLTINITKKIDSFQNNVTAALAKMKSFNNSEIENSMAELREALNATNDLMKTTQNELEAAKVRSEELGNHNKTITDIAETVMKAVETITNKSDKLLLMTEHIKTATKDVCNTAETFESKQNQIRSDADTLLSELNDTVSGAMTMKSYVQSFSADLAQTYNETQSLNKQIVDITVLEDNEISAEIAVIKFDWLTVESIAKNISSTTIEFEESINSIDEYLSKVENRQSIIEHEFVLLQTDEKDADIAIEETTEIFTKAKTDYENLIEFQKVKQQIEDLMKTVPNIESKIKTVRENSKDVKQIFIETLDIIETNQRLSVKVDSILTELKDNETIILERSQSVDEISKEQEEVSDQLTKLHEELKNVKFNHDKLKLVETETQDKVQQIQEYLLVLNTIPSSKEELSLVEKEIETLELMYSAINGFQAEKELLEKEVARVKEILENFPLDDKTLCEAPESEPKLRNNTEE
ncbi:hypothetical protein RN001_009825 [Aquatica leii]|uniref:Laminin EGF-like domain-containing protein n=1 Tax=Aquatica leii TaxID=1421715 RepID=A0AAN7SFT6_9COLE|nr:hypothetical protein RN001_009825 [Aquatica leii]